MSGQQNARILAGRPAVDFIGRTLEAERLAAHAKSTDGILILAAPGAGASELLKQTFDSLFREQQDVIPFYFSVRPGFNSAAELARTFLDEFIRQLIAFRRQDGTIIRSAATLDELAELSLSLGGFWIDRLIEMARSMSSIDGRSLVRSCLGAPIRAAANRERSFVMIDSVHELERIDGGLAFLDELRDIYADGEVSFALSGYRRFLHGTMDCDRLELDNLKFPDASRLVEVFSKEDHLAIANPARDLIATQIGGNAVRTAQLLRTAKDSGFGLERFEDVEKAYSNALFGGRIGRDFDRMFSQSCGDTELERRVLAMLFEIQASEERRVERSLWCRRLRLSDTEADSLLHRLNVNELIRLMPAHVEAMSENVPLTDYVEARCRLTTADSRAIVFGDSLVEYIKRAPEMMARRYRANWSVGIREVLGSFSRQQIPSILLDYGEFRTEFKGVSDDTVFAAARSAPLMDLPRIFFTTTASAFYKPIAKIAESERSAIALGFEAEDIGRDTEVVWIAAEVDSKLEATADIVEFWCDRLEAAALMCDFAKFRIWLVAPEGFSPEALEVLRRRNGYGSSRRQVQLLRKFLNASPAESNELAENEYEMVIPMGEDAELIAAHAVEEIARRHNFDPRSINQIKTALVEACINASEHSLSPDGKIYQRFRIEDDRVVLTVSNRGLRLVPEPGRYEPQEGRRGWGLKLMRQLMDEVTIEHVDDGTRIVMTKRVPGPKSQVPSP